MELAVAAGESEALGIMDKPSAAYPVNGVEIYHHGNIHFRVQQVAAVFQALFYLLPFPGVLGGNVVKFGFSVQAFQVAGFCQFVLRAAVFAGKGCALALGLALGIAMGAVEQNPV